MKLQPLLPSLLFTGAVAVLVGMPANADVPSPTLTKSQQEKVAALQGQLVQEISYLLGCTARLLSLTPPSAIASDLKQPPVQNDEIKLNPLPAND